MYIARIVVRNFRNFEHLDCTIQPGATCVIGENNTGKTNLLYAIRLVVDSGLSSVYRQLTELDLHSGQDFSVPNQVVIALELRDYKRKCNEQALVGSWEVEDDLARIMYRFRPRDEITEAIEQEEHPGTGLTLEEYHWQISVSDGSKDPASIAWNETCGASLRFGDLQGFQVILLPAIRDVQSDLRQSRLSPLGRILEASLFAGSAWLFANERFDRHLDYLFIDEAGQVSVANVVAMGTAARNIVLVGDQMQLGQPIQGVHPGEAGLSILDFLLGNRATVTPDRGIFLNHTRRLHPSVCQFISEAFYEGRLAPDPGNVNRHLTFQSPIEGITPEGIHFLSVNHTGCSQKSEEEGRTIKEYFQKLVSQTFVDKDGSTRVMTPNDILVVSPYNVQVNHLKSVLLAGARVGTVDKFQGQEAPVVLTSMATSDSECLPRDIEFLFSANRLNVALSRAQCLAVVVASPRLLETPCRTIEQLRLVNKFCQFVEFAANSNKGASLGSAQSEPARPAGKAVGSGTTTPLR